MTLHSVKLPGPALAQQRPASVAFAPDQVYSAGWFWKDPMLGGHAIKIMGFGTENGTPSPPRTQLHFFIPDNEWSA